MFPTTVNQFRSMYAALEDVRHDVEGMWTTTLDVSDGFEATAMRLFPDACIWDVAPGRAGVFSDAHKEAYGFRPRSRYTAPTCAQYDAEIARLDAMVIEELDAQCEAEAEWRMECAREAEDAQIEVLMFPVALAARYLDWDLPDRLAAA
jgi:hypothetical protein